MHMQFVHVRQTTNTLEIAAPTWRASGPCALAFAVKFVVGCLKQCVPAWCVVKVLVCTSVAYFVASRETSQDEE